MTCGQGLSKIGRIVSGTIVCKFEHFEMWSCLALMPDGRRIVGSSDFDYSRNAIIREHGLDPSLTASPAV